MHGISLGKIWILFTQEYFVQSLVEIGPTILEEKIFKSFIYIIYMCIERGQIHLIETEFRFRLLKDGLCLVWLKLAK